MNAKKGWKATGARLGRCMFFEQQVSSLSSLLLLSASCVQSLDLESGIWECPSCFLGSIRGRIQENTQLRTAGNAISQTHFCYFKLCVSVCKGVCILVQVPDEAKGVRSSRAGFTGSHEHLIQVPGIKLRSFTKAAESSLVLFTAESLPAPQASFFQMSTFTHNRFQIRPIKRPQSFHFKQGQHTITGRVCRQQVLNL